MKVTVSGIEHELGSKGVWLKIKTPDGRSQVGWLNVGMKWVEWWPKGSKTNYKRMTLKNFITEHLEKMPPA
jgi:hypothetical protein